MMILPERMSVRNDGVSLSALCERERGAYDSLIYARHLLLPCSWRMGVDCLSFVPLAHSMH
ncbi:hypothetical protein I7I50_09561 [Histoplasma capsulatum G186AR]|uniref:Uncharacterized protein n=1 Tax=Ajellomyces capsulatus TaxID=5037 RepID=A0A8H8D0D7_AJECA|nr:hypothetical protein I7I52_07082 [Histoplasma capsulatum]QSS74417.1 hypothetical protein I7I50_09561 [Histoplasma capsulatum G186AR]